MTDLGTLGGSTSTARGINSAGIIVGDSSTTGGATHAFSYSGAVMTDLGTLGGTSSWGYGINRAGTIVGQSDTSGGQSHAFSYSGGVMTDLAPYLASVGLTGTSYAEALNDNGDVVGYGTTAGGYQHAFLLTPLPTLHISPSGADLIISWRTNSIVSFSLFQNTGLAAANWTTVTITPTVNNDQKQVVISGPLTGSRYYRLQSQ
jgi:probable HAF family extracellular repeat protein